MTSAQISSFVRLWQTSTWAWRAAFLAANGPDVTGPVLKALGIGTATELVERMKAGADE